jgi:O-antigen/teichoic acid export membrane protein
LKPSIASDTVNLTISKVITLTIVFVNTMLLSRVLTLEDYGTYSQLLLVVNLLTSIFMLGLPNSINYFLASCETNADRQKFLSVYYTLSTILSIFTGFLLVISTRIITDYFDNDYIKSFLYVLAVYPWARIIQSSIQNLLVVYQKTKYLMLFNVLYSVSKLSIILIVQIIDGDFALYMLLFIIVEAIFALSVYAIVKNLTSKITIYIDTELIKSVLKFSLPLGIATMIGTISIELDKLMIAYFFDTEQLAIYTNAAREMPVTIVASSLTAVLMPQLVRLLHKNKKEEAILLWSDATILSFIFISFFASALFVFAPEVISLLYSDKYLPGVEVFQIYSILLLFRCTYFGMVLNSMGKTKVILYTSMFSLVFNVVLNFTFIKMYGFIGPAIATVLTIALTQALQLIATSHNIKIPFKNIFPWRALFFIMIINIVLGGLFSILKESFHIDIYNSNIVETIVLGLLWAGIYIVIFSKYIKQKWIVLKQR